MHSVSFTGNQTYWDISRGYEEGTYFLSLPDFSSDFTRLQVDPSGNINMVPQSFNGSWESFIFTEVTPTTRVVHLRKRNASGFAIDGNHGGENGLILLLMEVMEVLLIRMFIYGQLMKITKTNIGKK